MSVKNYYSDEETDRKIREISELIDGPMSIAAICKKVGCTRYFYTKHFGSYRKSKNIDAERVKVEMGYSAGMSLDEIMKNTGCSLSFCSQVVNEFEAKKTFSQHPYSRPSIHPFQPRIESEIIRYNPPVFESGQDEKGMLEAIQKLKELGMARGRKMRSDEEN